MKNIQFLIIVFALFVLQSCDEDSFSSVVKIDIPEHKSALSITSHLMLNSDSISVFVSHSLGILDKKDYDVIDQAKVELYKDNDFLTRFEYDADHTIYFQKEANLISEGNHIYRLEVTAPGYETAKAEQTMPTTVNIDNVKFTKDGTINDEGMRADELLVEFTDPAGEENFYEINARILLSEERTAQGVNYFYGLYTLDPLVEYGHTTELLKDITFDGRKYTIRFASYSYNEFEFEMGDRIIISLKSISKDKFLFHKTRGIYSDSQDNPFSEPVVIHENVENGHGIFTLSSESIEMIEF